jgi:hypothetical protein
VPAWRGRALRSRCPRASCHEQIRAPGHALAALLFRLNAGASANDATSAAADETQKPMGSSRCLLLRRQSDHARRSDHAPALGAEEPRCWRRSRRRALPQPDNSGHEVGANSGTRASTKAGLASLPARVSQIAKTEAHTATCRIMAVHRRCVLSQVGLLQPLGGARALAVSRDRLALAPPPRI